MSIDQPLPKNAVEAAETLAVVRPCGTRISLTRRDESTEARWINQQLYLQPKGVRGP